MTALLVVTGAVSLAVGLATARASAPVGPHEATWSTTLDSTVTLDLGPLGAASIDSPAGPLGVEVVLGEIPSGATQADVVDPSALGESLSSDAASYVGLVTHPELTVQRGLHALLHDGLRRAGVVEGVLLCLVAAAHMTLTRSRGGATRSLLAGSVGGQGYGRTDVAWGALLRRPPVVAATAALLAAVTVLLVPALRSAPVHGARLAALEGTPVAGATLSGRVADVVTAYGPRVTDFLETNEAFYSQAEASLRTAWAVSQETGGTVEVTAADGQVDVAQVRQRAAEAAEAEASAAADAGTASAGTETPGESPGVSATPTGTQVPTPGASPEAASTTAPVTGARAVPQRGAVTAVLSTDLHCNLDVIAFTGVLDEVSGADVHMDDGDLTMTGSDPEQLCVDALSQAVPSTVDKVATIGNHDSESTAARLRSQGWTVTDGTIQEVGGLRVLGQDDPERTTATGTTTRSGETAEEVGARLAATSCTGSGSDVVLIHQPATFGPLVSQGCAPLLLAGHVHAERGMTTSQGSGGEVSALVSGAGKGGTSLGAVTQDAYLHVLSFAEDGSLVAWRAVVLHPDASVTVGAWQAVPPGEPIPQPGAATTSTAGADQR
ncbi:serine/threonine protein phosphatase [Actinomyces lilanjuaniae]|uniref:Serine/threonine protein phosphatase n=1 Tax=Actinomyces lilanjuaniae TaxID=2321394 RepID=A0ABN5PT10_9ACTO|nr:serine/threonine protein phosphatase [Actinomyces lilanjuaniae]AYD89990.1 serine/threonine protein phosphatase [Actinomyces lilanjuaniae]